MTLNIETFSSTQKNWIEFSFAISFMNIIIIIITYLKKSRIEPTIDNNQNQNWGIHNYGKYAYNFELWKYKEIYKMSYKTKRARKIWQHGLGQILRNYPHVLSVKPPTWTIKRFYFTFYDAVPSNLHSIKRLFEIQVPLILRTRKGIFLNY